MKFVAALLSLSLVQGQLEYPQGYPRKRFVPWKYRDSDAVAVLGYTEESWNFATNYGDSNVIEDTRYGSLPSDQTKAISSLDISQAGWDCWVNHYYDYLWNQLPQSVKDGLTLLGFDQALWDSDGEPESFEKAWGDLLPTEQTGATSICFTEQMWNEIPLDGRVLYLGVENYVTPLSRLTAWASLSTDQRASASTLGYTEETWNIAGVADIEADSWFEMEDAQAEAVINLGFDPWTWDCTVNHFFAYGWSILDRVEMDLTETLEVFGWDSVSWDTESSIPAAWQKVWGSLTAQEKEAAERLCFNELTWDETFSLPLDGAPTLLPSSAPSISPSLLPSTVPSASAVPSSAPSSVPSVSLSTSPSGVPSIDPTVSPSLSPSTSAVPSDLPSSAPSPSPTSSSMPSDRPSVSPTMRPSWSPSDMPSSVPTISTAPSSEISLAPSDYPSMKPSTAPSVITDGPSSSPSVEPTVDSSASAYFASLTIAIASVLAIGVGL